MTMHSIALTTRDHRTVAFDCGEGETLLDAAARASIVLPSECKGGGCGACRVTRRSGDVTIGTCSEEALPPAERERGGVLLCRTQPRSALALDAPFDHADILFGTIPVRDAEVVAIDDVGGNVRRLVLQLVADDELGSAAQFAPGQFMEIDVPGQGVDGGALRRAYSLANTANWDGRLDFLVRLHPAGRFSGWLRERARIGDHVQVRGPQGRFTLHETSIRPRVLVAGGTGIAPILSMLHHMAELQDTTPVHVLFGVNRTSELFGLECLERLRSELPGLVVTHCVWEFDPAWQGFIGTPVDALRSRLAEGGTRPDVYLCGPPALISAATEASREGGVPDSLVFSEAFVAATP
jgi:ferredoxin-NADP reductase/ferredoxin